MNTNENDHLNWHKRENDGGDPFDPTSLVALARVYGPHLVEAFTRCTRKWSNDELYTYFMSGPDRGKRWRYAGGVELEHPTLGTLLVDLVLDPTVPGGKAIGGIEYLDRVMDPERHLH